MHPDAVADAVSTLEVSEFFLDSHKRIYRAISKLHEAKAGIDYQTVCDQLRKTSELDSVGGLGYVIQLENDVPGKPDVSRYVRVIKDKALARRLAALAYEDQQRASDPSQDPQALLEAAIESRKGLLESSDSTPMATAGEYLASQGDSDTVLNQMATLDGLKLGWTQFDKFTGGLQRQELMILAAMAMTGKTAWVCNAVHNVSVVQGKVCAFFPFEQKKKSAIRRMASSTARVPYRSIRDNDLTAYQRAELVDQIDQIKAAPLYMDDAYLTMTQIKARCYALKRKLMREGHPTGLDLIVLDQLSHIDESDVMRLWRNSSTEERIGKQGLLAKLMAEELDVPVILVVQMTQEGAKRQDPRPRITDIAGSGKLKNHADLVAFLHRPELFDKDDSNLKGKGEMILAKNREGQIGTCHVKYAGSILAWIDDTEPDGPTQERIPY